MSNLKYLIFASCFSCLYLNVHANVVFATVLFRHGDRTPIDPYPNDPWGDENLWPTHGWGQLTDIGKNQHYELGKFLRQRYQHLLSDRFCPNEIYIRSTDYDRTIMSALTNLAGMYPTSKKTQWNSNIDWQPIPVHVVPIGFDYLLMRAPCPNFDAELTKLLNTDTFKKIDIKLAPLYKYLTLHTGREVDSMIGVSRLYDTLMVEKLYNFTLPEWTKPVYEKMKKIGKQSFLLQSYNPVLQRLIAGPLIGEITGNLLAASKGNLTETVIMYSGHDVVIANILNSLKMYDYVPPSYAATVLFELMNVTNQFYVRVTYKGNVLNIPDCGTMCPISKWIDNYKSLIPDDIYAECYLQEFTKSVWEISYSIATVILLLLSAVLIYKRIYRRKNNLPDIVSIEGNTKTTYQLMS